MKTETIRKYMLPPGPVLSLILVGIMVLSALLYYRAVKIQRFLEPALALAQPRSELAEQLNSLLIKEFGPSGTGGVTFAMGAVVADSSLFFDRQDRLRESVHETVRKLNVVFLSALLDEYTRSHVGVILVGSGYEPDPDIVKNRTIRQQAQHRAEMVMDQLLSSDARLAREFGTFFVAAAIPASMPGKGTDRIEFRIIPSEMLHVEVLQRLTKYAQ
ncbi:MAG: hypothetical protein M0Z79_01305 [Nitrospiraceae bacterium]|nr:hypothetical protein [Nitrospiraceae bacterium]